MPNELIKQSMAYEKLENKVPLMEEAVEEEKKLNGINEIWNLMDPIWRYSREQLVKFMLQRIIYQTGILYLNSFYKFRRCDRL